MGIDPTVRTHIPKAKPHSLRCLKCGDSWEHLLCLALLQDMGCSVSPGPTQCAVDGGEHDFSHADPAYAIPHEEQADV
jgi:hypothetical protein